MLLFICVHAEFGGVARCSAGNRERAGVWASRGTFVSVSPKSPLAGGWVGR